jgi:hypothetical protein
MRLNERYAPAFEVGFVAFARIGGLTKIVGSAKPVLSITVKANFQPAAITRGE